MQAAPPERSPTTGRPTIGVVMSVWNGAPLVGATLASLAGQTRQPDAVVAVDDGSDDATGDVLRSWSGRLPLTVLRQEQRHGAHAGRNRALEALDTELMVILDGDDLWLPGHLEGLEATYLASPGIAACRMVWWLPGDTVSCRSSSDLRPVPPTEQLTVLLQHNYVPISSLCRRDDVVAVGGFRPPQSTADWDLWLRLVRRGARVAQAPAVTMLYRTGHANLSSAPTFHDDELAVLERFLAEEDDATLRAVAARSLRRHRAARSVAESHQLVAGSRPWAARRAALPALASPGRTRWHGVGMVLAPRALHRWAGAPAARRRRLVGLPGG